MKSERMDLSKQKTGTSLPLQVKFFGRICHWVVQRIFCRLVGFLLIKKIRGLKKIPVHGSFLVVPNHSSFVDFMLVMDSLRKRRFLTFFVKKKYYDIKILTHVFNCACQLRADNESVKTCINALKSGIPVILFAEGTRTRNGKVGKAYPGLGIIGSTAGVPVIPMGIKGAFQFWPWNKKIPNPFHGRRIEINFGRPVTFEKFSNPDEFSKNIMNKVKQLAKTN